MPFDAIQAVDLAFDAPINEIDLSKMRVFLSDVLSDRDRSGNKTVTIPFGKSDCTVFRKVMSTLPRPHPHLPENCSQAQREPRGGQA